MITIYSKDGCPYCEKGKALLSEYNIDFTEVNIAKDTEAKDFVVGNGHTSVPQFYVNDSLLVEGGYDALSAFGKDEIIQKVNELNGS